jgi:phosphoribosylformimino-5-aminoimidazole carboxamide ribotide isomerase
MWFELAIEVIPAVDVLGDESVRLERGDYDRVVERAHEPVALARRWVDAGAQRVHLVDLDGARSGQIRPELVAAVAAAVRPALLQASGGIRSTEDARLLLAAGADRVVVGTAAWPDPEPWLELGAVIALDVRDGQVMGRGWTEGSGVSLADALARLGNALVLLTAIDRDGTLGGPDLELVRHAAAAGARVLAAGGVRSPEDVEALAAVGAEAAVVGRALLRGDER